MGQVESSCIHFLFAQSTQVHEIIDQNQHREANERKQFRENPLMSTEEKQVSDISERKQFQDNSLVAIEELANKRGSIFIRSRYITERGLEHDYEATKRIIGTGMSGAVKLLRNRRTGYSFATKSFKKDTLDAHSQTNLKNEVEIFLSLDHPHIARLYEVYEDSEEIHLVMEYMSGGELYQRVASQRCYTEEAAADAIRSMLLAVSYLHVHRICHRDLKLENFLYESTDSDHVKLIDFGLAKFHAGKKNMTQACGSVHYMAPEVLAKSYTRQADLWSLGVISHMLLTGRAVFAGSEQKIFNSMRTGRVRLSSRLSQLSFFAQHFVKSLLQVDPTARLTAQKALAHPFIANGWKGETALDVGIVDSLRSYARASHFRRACFSIMAWTMPQESRRTLRGKFLEFDVESKGVITLAQFKMALREKYKVDPAEAETLFAILDTDSDNKICYSEFLAAIAPECYRAQEEVLLRTFRRFDRERVGMITVDDLRKVLGDSFDDVEVGELLREADTDGKGSVCFEKFFAHFQQPESDSETTTDSERDIGVSVQGNQGQSPKTKSCEVDSFPFDDVISVNVPVSLG
jgi:calcium-dependent protein kinase